MYKYRLIHTDTDTVPPETGSDGVRLPVAGGRRLAETAT